MNKAIISGNLTEDIELKETTTGKKVCTFTVAVNRRYADANGNRQTDFLRVVCWRELAEVCAKYLCKGRKVLVTGQIQSRQYEAQDATKRTVTEIVADEVEFLSSRKDGEATSSVGSADSFPGGEAKGEYERLTPADDDELPF